MTNRENKKKIVFYCATHPFEFHYKIAKMFRHRGYETILFTMSERDRFDYNFYSEAFDKIICSNFQFHKPGLKTVFYLMKRGPSLLKFLIHLKYLKPYAVIGISGANWQLKLVHKHFFNKYPFIYFPYDILSHSFSSEEEAQKEGLKEFEKNAEKYCFENSDGVIHKGAPYELEFVKGVTNKELKIQKFQLNFMPYCSEEFIIPINKNKISKIDKEIHLVGIGNFSNEPNSKEALYDFLDSTLKQKIHSHFYIKVSHISKKDEEDYIKNLFGDISKSRFFHIHNPMDPREIVQEISKYDYGFWISYGKEIPEVKFGMGNRVATHFEACVPLIVDERAVFLNKLMSSYGLKISFNKKNIKNIGKKLDMLDYKKLERNILKARHNFSMEKNFPRLERFIEAVVEKKKNS